MANSQHVIVVGDVSAGHRLGPGKPAHRSGRVCPYEGAGVPEMGHVIRGDPADIHPCGGARRGRPHPTRRGVVQPQRRAVTEYLG